jgi:hypothetical protein
LNGNENRDFEPAKQFAYGTAQSLAPPPLSLQDKDAGAAGAGVSKCATPPTSGEELAGYARTDIEGHVLAIRNGSGHNAIVKMHDALDGTLAASFYIAKGAVADFSHVPDGSYDIEYGLGGDLAADCSSFVQTTLAGKFPGVQIFTSDMGDSSKGNVRHQRLTYTFSPGVGGNVDAKALDPAIFNAKR